MSIYIYIYCMNLIMKGVRVPLLSCWWRLKRKSLINTEEDNTVDEEWRLKRMSLMMEKKERGKELLMKSRRLNSEVWRENCWCWGKKEIVAAVDEEEVISRRSQRFFLQRVGIYCKCWMCVDLKEWCGLLDMGS